MITLLEVLTKGTSYLEGKGVESARLNMELIVAHCLQVSRMQLYLQFDKPLEDKALVEIRSALKARGERKPLQHILGSVEFCGHEFLTDSRALVPRPETEEITDYLIKMGFPLPCRVLDLCCGSGVMGLSLKKALGEQVELVMADISEDALSLCRENAEKLNVEAEVVQTDVFSNVSGVFDLIVCNPPYIAADFAIAPEVAHDPHQALFSGEDGLDLIRRIVPEATQHLVSGGLLVMEIGFDQGAIVEDLLRANGYQNILLKSDIDNIPRFPIARWK